MLTPLFAANVTNPARKLWPETSAVIPAPFGLGSPRPRLSDANLRTGAVFVRQAVCEVGGYCEVREPKKKGVPAIVVATMLGMLIPGL